MRNLANGVTEEILEKSFSQFGKLERVKKLKDYAFIHFEERDGAVKVMQFFIYLLIRHEFCDFLSVPFLLKSYDILKFPSLNPIHPYDC